MNKQDLVNAIERRRGTSSYKSWTIGITGDPKTRKQEHENEGQDVTYWTQWLAESEDTAREVESYFTNKGMKGGTGGPVGTPTYVYIF